MQENMAHVQMTFERMDGINQYCYISCLKCLENLQQKLLVVSSVEYLHMALKAM